MSAAGTPEWVRDTVYDWADALPGDRFTGTTVEDARLSVSPDEVVELAFRIASQMDGGAS